MNLFGSIWNWADSYGRLIRELGQGFRDQGETVNCYGPGSPEGVKSLSLGGIFAAPAGDFKLFDHNLGLNGPRLGITMFEGTRLPPAWIPALRKMHRIIVPSRWLVDVFQDNGIHQPIEVVPLGISDSYMKPMRRVLCPKVYTFLASGDAWIRKGWHITGWAFDKAFKNSKAVQLVYKVRGNNLPFKFANENVFTVRGDWTDRALYGLYISANAFPNPNAGEGFGFLPREFAATGGPAITTNFGGTADEIEQWAYPLSCTTTRAWADDPDYGHLGGRWALPDVDALAERMTWLVEHQAEAADFGMHAATAIQRLYPWSAFVRRVYDIWQQTVAEFEAGKLSLEQDYKERFMVTDLQRTRLRTDVGDTGTPSCFTTGEVDDFFARAESEAGHEAGTNRWHLYACRLAIRQILADTAKMNTYTQNQTTEQAGNIFDHFLRLDKIFAAELEDAENSELSNVRWGAPRHKPTRLKEYPNT